jgi:unsaturated rhamnogalacturonyl hydrolase
MVDRFRIAFALSFVALIIVFASPTQAQQPQPKEFRKWPASSSPQEIGKRVAERLASTPHSNFSRPGPPPFITYPEVATWYGALTFAPTVR